MRRWLTLALRVSSNMREGSRFLIYSSRLELILGSFTGLPPAMKVVLIILTETTFGQLFKPVHRRTLGGSSLNSG